MSDENSRTLHPMRIYSDISFDNLDWLTSDEAAYYLRKSVGALRTMVSRGQIKANKWRRRLYFKKCDLDKLLSDSMPVGEL